MRTYSACIELLFKDETDDFIERIHLAHEAGLSAIELWRWSNKDLFRIDNALRLNSMSVALILAEPICSLTDVSNLNTFVDGVARSARAAQKVGAKLLVAQGGEHLPGVADEEQDAAIISCLRAAGRALEGTGVRLGIEPLNTLIDHPGQHVSSTRKGLELVKACQDPRIGIVFDLYHSGVMGENVPDVLSGEVQHVFHVHVADHPGRHEPGTGDLALREGLNWIFANGYQGMVGLEYKPSFATSNGLRSALKALS